jgi:tungstate transport system substrate-binding protein
MSRASVLVQNGSMLRFAAIALSTLVVALAGCGDGGSGGKTSLILATTTSTQDSGLLDVLIPAFERDTGMRLKTLAVGSGEALELGERGEADVLLVHSPAAEEELMATGKAGERRLVMHNDFVVVGPAGDRARIAGKAAAEAFRAIADAEAPFVSRGDDSGTHKAELGFWEDASVQPGGGWYSETGQGMGATLRVADERGAYTLADRATYLAQPGELNVLVEGDPELLNVYHVIDMTEKAGDRVNVDGARRFADWVVSPEVQATIGAFGKDKYGRALFTPDAGKTDEQVTAAA